MPKRQVTNKVNKEKDKRKHRYQEKKILKQIDVYSSLLEGKQRQFLTKPDKIKFLNELAKQKHCVNAMHTNKCVTFYMSFDTPQSNSSALFFLKKLFYGKQRIMPFRNNSVNQN